MRTFAPAFEEQCSGKHIRKSSLKDLHRQIRIVVQEASAFSGTWVKRSEPSFLFNDITGFDLDLNNYPTSVLGRMNSLRPLGG